MFDSKDVDKNIFGDKRSDTKGWKAKINVGAEGEIFELVENAQYDGSKAETGKNIAAHYNVDYWDYFIKTVQIDGKVFDLLANVRKKPDNSFVYSIQLKENKKMRDALSVIAEQARLGDITETSLNESLSQFRKEIKPFKEENNINYSKRVSKEESARSIIANTLESVATTDAEREILARYKEKLSTMEKKEAKLASQQR